MSLTACKEYKLFGICLNFFMSVLPKTRQRNSGNRTAMACKSASNITAQHLLILSACSWSLLCMHNCQSMASTDNKFLIYCFLLYSEQRWYDEFISCFEPNCTYAQNVANCVVWWLVDLLFILFIYSFI